MSQQLSTFSISKKMGLGGNCTSLAPGKEKLVPKVKNIKFRLNPVGSSDVK